jgi:hypothetical protein
VGELGEGEGEDETNSDSRSVLFTANLRDEDRGRQAPPATGTTLLDVALSTQQPEKIGESLGEYLCKGSNRGLLRANYIAPVHGLEDAKPKQVTSSSE